MQSVICYLNAKYIGHEKTLATFPDRSYKEMKDKIKHQIYGGINYEIKCC